MTSHIYSGSDKRAKGISHVREYNAENVKASRRIIYGSRHGQIATKNPINKTFLTLDAQFNVGSTDLMSTLGINAAIKLSTCYALLVLHFHLISINILNITSMGMTIYVNIIQLCRACICGGQWISIVT